MSWWYFFSHGCSAIKFKTPLERSPSDWTMYGKSPERQFTDTSTFTFPLTVAWEYDASAGFAQSPMTIVGNTMFVGTLQGELHAVNLETGKRFGYMKTFSPVQAAPTLFHEYIIIATESGKENLIAYKMDDGEERWIRDMGGVVASPLVWNDRLIVGGLNGKLTSFEQYGIEQWSFNTGSEIRSSPALANGIVYCASAQGKVFALDATSGALVWQSSTGSAVYAGLTVADSTLIVASRDSSIYLFNAATGELLKKISTTNKIMASPSSANGALYVPSLEGTVTAYSLENGNVLWEFTAKSVINTTPFITPSALFVASLDHYIYALDPATGAVLWKREMEARVKTTPLVWKNFLFVAAENKTIYCLRSAAP
ncbi:MAG: PQQ-binding-like beta-propeller repeat protein [Ignavibacteriales bacterium]|nr:PQQ-binding-like beta-propeller repeat protein [Ignavibacteriales bacterium]